VYIVECPAQHFDIVDTTLSARFARQEETMARFDGTRARKPATRPVVDYLTERLAGVISQAHCTGRGSFFRKACSCGRALDGATYSYNDTDIGPGAIHFIACHRSEVPHNDISWLEGVFGVIGRRPSGSELGA
jgi:hypothetical protein